MNKYLIISAYLIITFIYTPTSIAREKQRIDFPGLNSAIKPPKSFVRGMDFAYQIYKRSSINHKYKEKLHKIREIGYQVALETNNPDTFTFLLLEDKSTNAFALPGGFIFITEGMLKQDLSEEEIAHLLGHEIAHVTKDHHKRGESKRLKSQIMATLMSVAAMYAAVEKSINSPRARTESDKVDQYREQQAMLRTAVYGPQILSLLYNFKHTREFEKEADTYGRKYATSAGFNGKGAYELFSRLAKTDNTHMNHIWRTHPFMADRAFYAERAIKQQVLPPKPKQTKAYALKNQKMLKNYADYFYKLFLKNNLGHIIDSNKPLAKPLEYCQFLYEVLISINPHSKTSQEALDILFLLEKHKRKIYPYYLENYGELYTQFLEYHPKSNKLKKLKLMKEIQYSKMTKALFSEIQGERICKNFIKNFPSNEKTFEAYLKLLKSYLRTKKFHQISDTIEKSVAIATSDKQRKQIEDIASQYFKRAKKPNDIFKIAKLLNSDELHKLALETLPKVITKTKDLHNLFLFIQNNKDPELNKKSLLRKESLTKQYYQKAKFAENQGNKYTAFSLYTQITLYGNNTSFFELATLALDVL